MSDAALHPHYPRLRAIRYLFRRLIRAAFWTLTDFKVEGREHIPEQGPLLVVGNHFHYADPLAVIAASDWPIEFIAGTQRPNAPPLTRWLPVFWGTLNVRRGTGARDALKSAEAVVNQQGVLGLFPEGGSWAAVLRPPRPGAAFLASQTGARILPVGLDGLNNIFPMLRRGKRAAVTLRFGETFGPVTVSGRGRARREQLDAVGEEIMSRIRALIPPERHGIYSTDPAIREAALAVAAFPWNERGEG
jgi:1-acyl-sn-glycerol-3-phosphate acyltransferase